MKEEPVEERDDKASYENYSRAYISDLKKKTRERERERKKAIIQCLQQENWLLFK